MIRAATLALPRLGLFLLALVPVLTGALILGSIYRGQPDALTDAADMARRASYRVAITGHILGGSTMLLLGFLQFSAKLRVRFPSWHRWAGRLVIGAGVFFALSGLWMNAAAQAQDDSTLYDTAQNVMAVALIAALALGVRAIRSRNVIRHRVWMMRSYAISLGVATQTVLLLPVFLIWGLPEGGIVGLVAICAWAFNLAIAEVILRRSTGVRQ